MKVTFENVQPPLPNVEKAPIDKRDGHGNSESAPNAPKPKELPGMDKPIDGTKAVASKKAVVAPLTGPAGASPAKNAAQKAVANLSKKTVKK